VFPALELRRSFSASDLSYLANLCHGCGACYTDCQFAPPHEFAVNMPRALARVRVLSYGNYAWPKAFAVLFRNNGVWMLAITLTAVLIFIAGFFLGYERHIFDRRLGSGAFYALMPHAFMAAVFGAAFVFAVIALTAGARALTRDGGRFRAPLHPKSVRRAVADAVQLRYLDGGGGGCSPGDEADSDRRRLWHHVTVYGFLLCFAATCVATGYHYLLRQDAPYPWLSAPVLLGSIGGAGLLVGPLGLFWEKRKRNPTLFDDQQDALDVSFLAMLLLTSVSGFALLFARDTRAMGIVLAAHLGIVFALFITLPYGKFVHGIWRFLALVQYAREIHSEAPARPTENL
jgi:citrate/tricarballylate utilization protein